MDDVKRTYEVALTEGELCTLAVALTEAESLNNVRRANALEAGDKQSLRYWDLRAVELRGIRSALNDSVFAYGRDHCDVPGCGRHVGDCPHSDEDRAFHRAER